MFNSPFPLFDPFSLDSALAFPPKTTIAPPPELHTLDLLLAPTPDLHLFQDLQISSSFSSFNSFLQTTETDLAIKSLTDRVSALELGLRSAPKVDRKYTFTAEFKGPKELGLDRKYKWVAESKGSGDRSAKWVAEIKGPEDEDQGGIDRKYKWLAAARRNGAGDVKWSAEIKGKGRYAPVSRIYSWQSSTVAASEGEECLRKEKEKKSKKGKCVQLVEIEENNPSRAAVAIRKVCCC